MTKRKNPKDLQKVGRKTTYKPLYSEAVDTYLQWCRDNNGQVYHQEAKKFINKVELPTYYGYTVYLHDVLGDIYNKKYPYRLIPETTMQGWAEERPEFSVSLQRIKKEQKKMLLDKGLSGDYTSMITKLQLMNNHGYAEKREEGNTQKTMADILAQVEEQADADS